jgi:hypothetical protein
MMGGGSGGSSWDIDHFWWKFCPLLVWLRISSSNTYLGISLIYVAVFSSSRTEHVSFHSRSTAMDLYTKQCFTYN